MWKRALNRGFVGFLCGAFIGVFIVAIEGLITGGGEIVVPSTLVECFGSKAGGLLAHLIVSGLFGIVPMAGTIVYEFDSWSLLKQSLVHFLSYMVVFLIVGLSVGWFRADPIVLAWIVGTFAVGHGIIWLIMYVRCKRDVAHLNELLEDARE